MQTGGKPPGLALKRCLLPVKLSAGRLAGGHTDAKLGGEQQIFRLPVSADDVQQHLDGLNADVPLRLADMGVLTLGIAVIRGIEADKRKIFGNII